MHVVHCRFRWVVLNSGVDSHPRHRHKRLCTISMYFLFKYYRATQVIRRIFDGGQPVHCCLMQSLCKLYGLECQLKSRQLLSRSPPLFGETNESPMLLEVCSCLFGHFDPSPSNVNNLSVSLS